MIRKIEVYPKALLLSHHSFISQSSSETVTNVYPSLLK